MKNTTQLNIDLPIIQRQYIIKNDENIVRSAFINKPYNIHCQDLNIKEIDCNIIKYRYKKIQNDCHIFYEQRVGAAHQKIKNASVCKSDKENWIKIGNSRIYNRYFYISSVTVISSTIKEIVKFGESTKSKLLDIERLKNFKKIRFQEKIMDNFKIPKREKTKKETVLEKLSEIYPIEIPKVNTFAIVQLYMTKI
ncbi:hypothetical protein A3Q56_01393 [Intoshia linei]|uniref:Uncharacterized protein n=1 Tax=Intoshia linei TaxID=1819745 RepID=A0A177B903_9BILA|nr:hypothetical protein A3Q56_01393 [Intoshia linei]